MFPESRRYREKIFAPTFLSVTCIGLGGKGERRGRNRGRKSLSFKYFPVVNEQYLRCFFKLHRLPVRQLLHRQFQNVSDSPLMANSPALILLDMPPLFLLWQHLIYGSQTNFPAACQLQLGTQGRQGRYWLQGPEWGKGPAENWAVLGIPAQHFQLQNFFFAGRGPGPLKSRTQIRKTDSFHGSVKAWRL